jgi:nitrite transporter NirC
MVCLAIWCAGRLQNEVAKFVMIFACVLVFITSGFEHVVANMTTFSFGLMGELPHATIGEFARNVLFVGLGNLVGGGLLVGAANVVAAGSPRTDAADNADTAPPVAVDASAPSAHENATAH